MPPLKYETRLEMTECNCKCVVCGYSEYGLEYDARNAKLALLEKIEKAVIKRNKV